MTPPVEDPFSSLVSLFSARCEVFAHLQLKAPWGIDEAQQDCCYFSYVKAGRCIVELPDGQTTELKSGQLLLLPYGHAHKVMSDYGTPCLTSETLFAGKSQQEVESMLVGGQGESCQMMCGYFLFSPIQHWGEDPLYGVLPQLIVINAAAHSKLALILSWLYEENSKRTHGFSLAQKALLELLLLEVLRTLKDIDVSPSWLNALQDKHLSPVLFALQYQLNKDWTVEQLAQVAALSSSSFSARFRDVTGLPPLQFVRQWRCLAAAKLMRSTQEPLKAISAQCGFQSVDVFIRNFRQFHKMTPNQYRKAHLHL